MLATTNATNRLNIVVSPATVEGGVGGALIAVARLAVASTVMDAPKTKAAWALG